MDNEDISAWTHDHVFDRGSRAAERGTRAVMWITAATMVVEIVAGWWFNSVALLADGWHMSSHALAIGLSAFAYTAARKFARDPRFAFGTWKIEVLAGFASAIFLVGVAAMMVLGSVERLLSPQAIRYQEAMFVALLGLLVNIVCALILGQAHHHDHDHVDGHEHPAAQGHAHGRHHDLNLRAAYLHVIADAATSVLAIVALAGGWLYGWSWLDPAMGIVGANMIGIWAKRLIVDTGPEAGETRIADLHVWRVGKGAYSCAISVVTRDPGLTPARIRERLSAHDEIVHSKIEIQVLLERA